MTLNHRPDAVLKQRLYGSWLDPLGIAHRTIGRALDGAVDHARGRLLDVGCGKKPYWIKFRGRVCSYIGIEMPDSQSGSTVVDVYGSALALPFNSEEFETVLCVEVLEHVAEPSQLLDEVWRVLKPQGCLILTAPLTWGPHEVPNDFFRYTEFGLRHLAEKAGFVVERTQRTSGLWATIGQRASAFVYYHHGWKRPLLIKAPVVAICAIVQLLFSSVDAIYRHAGDTLDHLMIARKP